MTVDQFQRLRRKLDITKFSHETEQVFDALDHTWSGYEEVTAEDIRLKVERMLDRILVEHLPTDHTYAASGGIRVDVDSRQPFEGSYENVRLSIDLTDEISRDYE
jgi:hypothetical protein